MAETSTLISVFAGAVNPVEILTPLSPLAHTLGTVLGLFVSLAGSWLALAHWLHLRNAGTESMVRGLGWRIPVALVMVLIGILIIIGAQTNPVTHQREFIVVWVLVLLLTGFTLVFAGVDAWFVGQRATKRRLELIHQRRESIKQEIESLKSHFQSGISGNEPFEN
jgi:hypothetical protein